MTSRRSAHVSVLLAVVVSSAAVFAIPVSNSTHPAKDTNTSMPLTNLLIRLKSSSKGLTDVTGEGIDASSNHTNSSRPQGRSLFPGIPTSLYDFLVPSVDPVAVPVAASGLPGYQADLSPSPIGALLGKPVGNLPSLDPDLYPNGFLNIGPELIKYLYYYHGNPGTFGNTGLPSEVLTLLARANDEAEEDKIIDGIIDSMFPDKALTGMRFDSLPVPMAPAAAINSDQATRAVLMGALQPQMAAMNHQMQLMRMAPMMNLLRASAHQRNALNALALSRLSPKDLVSMMRGVQSQKSAVDARQGGSCGGKRIDTRFGSKGYMFSWLSPGAPRLDGNSARAFCRSVCMDLVSLESEAENQFIKSIVDQAWRQGVIQYIWLSGSRSGGGFVWGSGAPIPGPGQAGANWGIRQPDNREGAENCMALLNPSVYNDPSGQFTWHDISCHYQKPFVCEEV